MEWTKDEIKQYMIFSHPTKTLLHNKDARIKLVAEMDLFNNHIEFCVTDEMEEITYNSCFEISHAIDMFYEKCNFNFAD